APAPVPARPEKKDPFTSTVVLPTDTAVLAEESADERVQVGSLLRDRFLLQERITGGGMGVVYKAMDRRLAEAGDENPWVAIKVLSPQLAANGHALRALQQEAAKGRCLIHPNIVRFIDFDRDEDLHFIVMEWLEGRTLADILDSADSGSIDRDRAFRIFRQVGKALEYAHRCGIVHADVKPGNVMVLPNGDAKLFDFGVARMRQKTLEKQPDFDPGVLGLMTPAYSSMQVLTGEPPTPSDDVFSLACLLYRLLAGYRVFGPRNAAEAAEKGMEPQPLQNVSETQWRVIKKALAYARVARFQSMSDFLEALDIDASEPITITVPAREEFGDAKQKRSGGPRWLIVVLGLATLAAAAEWRFGLADRIRTQLPSILAGQTPAGAASGTAGETQLEAVAPARSAAPDTGARTADESTLQRAPAEQAPAVPSELSQPEGESSADEAAGIEEQAGDAAPEELTGPPAAASEVATADVVGPGADVLVVDDFGGPVVKEPAGLSPPLVDFSKLPPPTAELRLGGPGRDIPEISVRIREDGAPVTIDLIRGDTDFALTLRLEEVSFSGNRSPWVAGQYSFTDDGFVEFPVGQDRARVTLIMTPDPIREADQQSTVRVREADSSISELALINVTLEDDDQRRFEATLPPNAIGFATSQITVREQDPAVQIDILRYNPDDTSMVIGYTIRDITATQGEDYFPPSRYTIEFGPGQRSARLLIPLVQDSLYENNEAFSVELANADTLATTDIYFRTVVLIRDDDN
ncbi:MAG: protein kinase, partial [Woeseiaceae bacterium]|nr:protein kinase [Woeseiaceae bacterium]